MTDEDELRDTFNYLVPLAKMVARQRGYRVWRDGEQIYTEALTGAWVAAQRYDATKSTSLWLYAAVAIPRYIVDEHRRDEGRKGGKRVVHHLVGLFQESPGNLVEDSGDEDYWATKVATEETGYQVVEEYDELLYLKRNMLPEDWRVLYQTYVDGMTLAEYGEMQGYGESWATRVRARATRRARELLRDTDAA